jgi:hypothetical protein
MNEQLINRLVEQLELNNKLMNIIESGSSWKDVYDDWKRGPGPTAAKAGHQMGATPMGAPQGAGITSVFSGTTAHLGIKIANTKLGQEYLKYKKATENSGKTPLRIDNWFAKYKK